MHHYFQKEEKRKMDQIKIFQNHGFMSQTRGIRPCLIHFPQKKKKKKKKKKQQQQQQQLGDTFYSIH